VTLCSEIVIDNSLASFALVGEAPDWLTISGSDLTRIFTITAGTTVVLANLVLTDGAVSGTERGAAIHNSGDLTLIGTAVKDSEASGSGQGGAIYSAPGSTEPVRDL
jgi:hypothetical protein